MRSLKEVIRLARELPAFERRRLLEELQKLEDETLPPEENEKLWADWVAQGPQGPLTSNELWP